MEKYNIKKENKALFHKEAHIYFKEAQDFFRFKNSYNKNESYTMWRVNNDDIWNRVMSITQILGEHYPFTGGDLSIAKKWIKKEMIYKKESPELIAEQIDNIEHIDKKLKDSVKRSQDEGTNGHDLIQTFIENYIKTGKSFDIKQNNVYWNAFKETLTNKNDTRLSDFIKQIKTVLPSEIPVMGHIGDGETYYAGKWDELLEMKDGRKILVDIKTGSNVKYDKKKKVGLQLNAYANLIKQSIDLEVDELICWEISYNINEDTNEREYFWEEHKFMKDDSFFDIVKSVINKNNIEKKIKEVTKQNKENEKKELLKYQAQGEGDIKNEIN